MVMKGKGWHNESHYHSLARMTGYSGKPKSIEIKPSGMMPQEAWNKRIALMTPTEGEASISEHNFSFDKKGKNYKLTLGNMSDAGWYWDGNKSDLAGYFFRLTNSKNDWVQKFQQEVPFSDVKDDIVASAQKGDGLYELSGDNRRWHFGETMNENTTLEQLAEDHGVENLANDVWNYIDATNYDDFKKSQYGKELKAKFVDSIKSATSWGDLQSRLKELNRDSLENQSEYESEKEQQGINKYLKAKK